MHVLALVFLVVTLSACLSSPGPTGSRPISAKESLSPVVAPRESSGPVASVPQVGDAPRTTLPPLTCVPTERLMAACRPCGPVIGAAQALAGCAPCPPPFTEAPRPAVGCPPRISPTPQPPAGRATLAFCSSLGPRPGVVPIPGAFCGSHFRPAEQITLIATGSHGRVSWTVTSDGTGAFRTLLPLSLCRLTPLTLVAAGSSGDLSNSVLVTTGACPPRP